jgi:hypothetical protein
MTYLYKPNILSLLPEYLTTHVEPVLADDTRLLLVSGNDTVIRSETHNEKEGWEVHAHQPREPLP